MATAMGSFRETAFHLLGRNRIWPLLVGAAFALLVVVTQNRVVAWEPGYNILQPGHHGWVSSHTLAIIAHATPENGFVGYALATLDQDGKPGYEYFDRYPVYFSAGMHALLSWKPRLTTQIFLAKQAMNGIFLLTVGAAYFLLRRFSLSTMPALAATILAFSSPYLIFYKDMVHYDQPALLGMLLLMLAIAEFKRGRRRYVVYLAAVLAVSLGRGYASLAVLFVWLGVDTLEVLARKISAREKASAMVALAALHSFLIGAGWAALNLGYNISVAAAKTGVAPLQTDIVGSAVNRLALSQEFNDSYASLLGWSRFASDEVVRIVRWSFPVWEYEGSVLVSSLIVAGAVIVILVWGRSMDRARRQLLSILALSGPLWIVGMRNLTAMHDYTAMYFIGIPLAFYGALAHFLRLPRAGWVLAVVLSLSVFAVRNDMIQDLHREIGDPMRAYTYDYMAIRERLPSEGQSIHLVEGIPYGPFAFGFFLPGHRLAPAEYASYIVASDPDLLPDNLTRMNSRVFLYKNR